MTDVNFRLDITGAPAAKAKVDGVRDSMNSARTAADKFNASRTAGYRKAEDDINRIRGLSVQDEIRSQNAQATAGRAALQRRLADYKRAKAEEARESERARSTELSRERMHAREVARARKDATQQQASAQSNSGLSVLAGQGAVGGAVGMAASKAISDVKAQASFLSTAGIDSVKSYAEFESLKINLEVLYKSTAQATRALSEMKSMSLKTGIGVEKFAMAATTMKGFGVATDLILPKLSQIAVIAKGDAEAMQRLGRAYGQAFGLGRLMAEERNQMVDAGFNPMLQIAKDTGKSMQQLTKDMANGKVGIDLLTAAFDNAVAKGGQFEGGMEKMSTKTLVQLNKLTEATKDLYRASGEALTKGGAVSLAGLGTDLLSLGSRGIRRASGVESFETGAKQDASGGSFIGGMIRSQLPSVTAGLGAEQGKRSLALQEQLDKINDKMVQKAKRIADIEKQKRAETDAWVKASAIGQAEQLRNAYQLNKMQRESAKDSLEAQKKLLETTKKTVIEAQKSLTTGVKGFASMSAEDRQASLKVLEKARGGAQLTFDESDKLEAVGSKEAKSLADRNRNRISRGEGLADLGQQATDRAVRPIDASLQAAKEARAQLLAKGRTSYYEDPETGKSVASGKFFSKKEQDKLKGLESTISDLEIKRRQAAQSVSNKVQSEQALYGNVFGAEQQSIRQGVAKVNQVTANIKQTIEFKAFYDNTATQIGDAVKAQLDEANNDQMKEVIKILKPLLEKVRTDRMNTVARAGLAGSK